MVLLTQFGANFISQLIASVADITKARVAAENIMNVINEPAVDMDNISDEGFRPVNKNHPIYCLILHFLLFNPLLEIGWAH